MRSPASRGHTLATHTLLLSKSTSFFVNSLPWKPKAARKKKRSSDSRKLLDLKQRLTHKEPSGHVALLSYTHSSPVQHNDLVWSSITPTNGKMGSVFAQIPEPDSCCQGLGRCVCVCVRLITLITIANRDSLSESEWTRGASRKIN